MGWLFTRNAGKAEIIQHLIAPEEDAVRRRATLAHCMRGNVLWAVVEITCKQENRRRRFIACYLLAKEKDCGWGYKMLEESMHPYYYTCPLRYLEMAPVTNADWRTGVHAWHRNRNHRPAAKAEAGGGQHVRL